MAQSDDSEYIGAVVDAETKGKFYELAGKRHMSMSALLREQVNTLLEDEEMFDDDSSEEIEA